MAESGEPGQGSTGTKGALLRRRSLIAAVSALVAAALAKAGERNAEAQAAGAPVLLGMRNLAATRTTIERSGADDSVAFQAVNFGAANASLSLTMTASVLGETGPGGIGLAGGQVGIPLPDIGVIPGGVTTTAVIGVFGSGHIGGLFQASAGGFAGVFRGPVLVPDLATVGTLRVGDVGSAAPLPTPTAVLVRAEGSNIAFITRHTGSGPAAVVDGRLEVNGRTELRGDLKVASARRSLLASRKEQISVLDPGTTANSVIVATPEGSGGGENLSVEKLPGKGYTIHRDRRGALPEVWVDSVRFEC